MGRRFWNEVTEVTPKHTKNHWWTQHQNIHRMPKNGCDFSPNPSGAQYACQYAGDAVNQQL